MTYRPKLNDYVRWVDSLGRVTEGWVYFICDESLSIEVAVKDKPPCEYTMNDKHKKTHVLVVCQNYYWHELEYIKSRQSVHDVV